MFLLAAAAVTQQTFSSPSSEDRRSELYGDGAERPLQRQLWTFIILSVGAGG